MDRKQLKQDYKDLQIEQTILKLDESQIFVSFLNGTKPFFILNSSDADKYVEWLKKITNNERDYFQYALFIGMIFLWFAYVVLELNIFIAGFLIVTTFSFTAIFLQRRRNKKKTISFKAKFPYAIQTEQRFAFSFSDFMTSYAVYPYFTPTKILFHILGASGVAWWIYPDIDFSLTLHSLSAVTLLVFGLPVFILLPISIVVIRIQYSKKHGVKLTPERLLKFRKN